ncbi:MAG: 4-hydroxythreonine-4-phosphate dehydrogenase PdxA [Candidatus Bipolaricaulota bacterium]
MVKPIIGITMGDPAGIGPEIAAKALAVEEIYRICRPFLIGDADALEQGVEIAGVGLGLHVIKDPSGASFALGDIDVMDLDNVDLNWLAHGQISKMAGQAALEYIQKAIDLAIKGVIDATVTNPIHKEAIARAGSPYPGHTEMYQDKTGAGEVAMMLVKQDFRVVHVSTHVALREACDKVKTDRVYQVIKAAHRAMLDLGISDPRIGVAGLNPHAGEGGLFGTEEDQEIIPAIEKSRGRGMNAEGPIPPDTIFAKTKGGRFEVAVAMYHDQGHIPAKLAGFTWNQSERQWVGVSGVNVTLGLPIIRTSVDHGTAFGKAGEGRALPDSLIEAIKLAAKFASGNQ